MKLNRKSFIMATITPQVQLQKIIIFTILIMSCTHISCNIIHRSQIEYNNINNDIEANNFLNRNDEDTIFENPVSKFTTDSFKVSKLLSSPKSKSNDHQKQMEKIKRFQKDEDFKKNVKIQNNNKLNFQNLSNTKYLEILEEFLFKYVKTTFLNSFIDLLAGKRIDKIFTDQDKKLFNTFQKQLHQFIIENKIENSLGAMETGRLFLYKGLKNLLWPLFIGVQIAKSILVALFLPSILGSLGIMVGKRLTSISGHKNSAPPIGDLDFPDTVFPLDEQYQNPRPDASKNHFYRQPYQQLTVSLNNENELSNSGFMDEKLSFEKMASKNTLEKNNKIFGEFLKVPGSSLLLSNYDPFYSPLLSRIDSIFSQFKINKDKEDCKSKLICLMYANPAKYAPYSNLVSAQLSRELNELQKPKNDSQEILRFFKYMLAAKGGQDGKNCEKLYETCHDFKDFEIPVMITTYNDINKLVQAKKFVN